MLLFFFVFSFFVLCFCFFFTLDARTHASTHAATNEALPFPCGEGGRKVFKTSL